MAVSPVAKAARGLEGVLVEDLDVQDEPGVAVALVPPERDVAVRAGRPVRGKGVRLAQKMQAGPCIIPVGIQL